MVNLGKYTLTIILFHNFVQAFFGRKIRTGILNPTNIFWAEKHIASHEGINFLFQPLVQVLRQFKVSGLCSQYLRTKASIFEGQPPQNKALSNQSNGHLGSR